MTGEDNMDTAAISKNNTMTRNRANVNKKATWGERFRKYILENAHIFAEASAMQTGNAAAAVLLAKNARECAAAK